MGPNGFLSPTLRSILARSRHNLLPLTATSGPSDGLDVFNARPRAIQQILKHRIYHRHHDHSIIANASPVQSLQYTSKGLCFHQEPSLIRIRREIRSPALEYTETRRLDINRQRWDG